MQWDQLLGLVCQEMVILPFRLQSLLTPAWSPWWAQLAASPYNEFGAFSEMVGLALGNTIRRRKGALAWGVEYWRHTTWAWSSWASFRTRTDRELPGLLSKPLILKWVEIRKIFISWVSCQFQRGRALMCKEGNHLWELFTVGSAVEDYSREVTSVWLSFVIQKGIMKNI